MTTKTKKTTKTTPASKKPSAKSATPKAAAIVEPPEPAKLVAKPARDKTTGRWGWCLREGKIEHHESKDTFDTEADATADGEKWLAEYARADADRRKMLGWKPVASAKAAKPETKASASKPKREKKATTAKPDKGLSCIDAAVKVLGETKVPMTTKEMVEAMLTTGYWKPTRGGRTPAATLYSGILREIQNKGAQGRFKKTDRGLFALTGKE